jgi:hypothetical protein
MPSDFGEGEWMVGGIFAYSRLVNKNQKSAIFLSFRIIGLGEFSRKIFDSKGLICKILWNKDLVPLC